MLSAVYVAICAEVIVTAFVACSALFTAHRIFLNTLDVPFFSFNWYATPGNQQAFLEWNPLSIPHTWSTYFHGQQRFLYRTKRDHESAQLIKPLGSLIDQLQPREEQILLSKVFAEASPSTRLIPFYYRRTEHFNEDDLTITTLVTVDRFPVLSRLVNTYTGPISVVIHVPDTSTEANRAFIEELHTLYTSAPAFRSRVDVHLARSVQGRQFNAWRNAARALARTNYIFALDVDFALCTDVRGAVLSNPILRATLADGTGALVVPAFEYTNLTDGTHSDTFPRQKRDLLQLVQDGRIGMFHQSWVPGHNDTNYERYYSASPGEVYNVQSYQAAYEPYLILRRDSPAWCDERFVGYGANKAACVFELHLRGTSFYVLADHFLVHQTHMYAEAARKHERKHNRRIFAEFKEEMCLRHLKAFYNNGLLHTSSAYNLRQECMKYEHIASPVEEMLQTSPTNILLL